MVCARNHKHSLVMSHKLDNQHFLRQDQYHIKDNDLLILHSKYQLARCSSRFQLCHMSKVYKALNYQNEWIRILEVNSHLKSL